VSGSPSRRSRADRPHSKDGLTALLGASNPPRNPAGRAAAPAARPARASTPRSDAGRQAARLTQPPPHDPTAEAGSGRSPARLRSEGLENSSRHKPAPAIPSRTASTIRLWRTVATAPRTTRLQRDAPASTAHEMTVGRHPDAGAGEPHDRHRVDPSAWRVRFATEGRNGLAPDPALKMRPSGKHPERRPRIGAGTSACRDLRRRNIHNTRRRR